jgi:hypothetical protein
VENSKQISMQTNPSVNKAIDVSRHNSAANTPEADTTTEEHLFRLQVQLDMQRERELLYKVVLVLECVVSLILLREWALWLFI